jgi:hypothetical protein
MEVFIMAETTNNSGVNTQANGSESTQMPNGVGATHVEDNDKIAKIRECLHEHTDRLFANADENVDAVLDTIFNAVKEDPIFFLTERKAVITLTGLNPDLNGFSYLKDFKCKHNVMQMQKYVVGDGSYENISNASPFLVDIQVNAFTRKSPAFTCYLVDGEIYNTIAGRTELVKRLAVVLNLDEI